MVRGGELRERLATTSAEVSREITDRGARRPKRLEDAVRLADDAIGTRVEDLGARLEQASQRVSETVTVQGAVSRKAFLRSATASAPSSARGSKSSAPPTKCAARSSARHFRATQTEAHTRLAGSGKEIVLAIATQGARVNEALNRTAETLASMVETRGKRDRGTSRRASRALSKRS